MTDLLTRFGSWKNGLGAMIAAGTFTAALLIALSQTLGHARRLDDLEAWKEEAEDSLRVQAAMRGMLYDMGEKIDNIETLIWCQFTVATVCPATPPTPPTRRIR
jgi:hypothetical protein